MPSLQTQKEKNESWVKKLDAFPFKQYKRDTLLLVFDTNSMEGFL